MLTFSDDSVVSSRWRSRIYCAYRFIAFLGYHRDPSNSPARQFLRAVRGKNEDARKASESSHHFSDRVQVLGHGPRAVFVLDPRLLVEQRSVWSMCLVAALLYALCVKNSCFTIVMIITHSSLVQSMGVLRSTHPYAVPRPRPPHTRSPSRGLLIQRFHSLCSVLYNQREGVMPLAPRKHGGPLQLTGRAVQYS